MVVKGLLFDDGINTPPEARFTYSPSSGGTVLDEFEFDASTSTDAEDPPEALTFRWDFDGNGVWDTNLSSSPLTTHTYSLPGTYSVRLLVTDSVKLSSIATLSVTVLPAPDYGEPGPVHDPFQLPYGATDAVFDPVRPYLYISNKTTRSVYFVNLETGLTERQFRFELTPESLAVTPDGSRLFVCLLAQEHSYYWWLEEQWGYIAGFDLSEKVKDREFWIPVDPYDIVATSNGQLVISSGSGQWTAIIVCESVNGTLLGSKGSAFQMMKLALHPSEAIVYGADTQLSPSDIYHLDLAPDGSLGMLWGSPYHGQHRMDGNVWCSPTGDFVITRGGDVFTAGMAAGADMLYIQSMSANPIEALLFDSANDMIVTIEGICVNWYGMSDRAIAFSMDLGVTAEFIGLSNNGLFAIDVDAGWTTVIAVPPPAP
jgi:PKD repeat protein